jgi:hypothetical protein
MEYFMMQPPFENVVFKEMKNKEAQAYFDWYIAEIPIRTEMLKKIVEEEANIQLDYSPNSLIALWEWYEDKILLVERDKALYQKALDNAPEWFKPYVSDKFLSYDTLIYAMDIAIYYGELIIKNNSKIYWGYFTKPKNRSGVNEPTLLGLPGNDDLNPREIIYNLTQRSAKEKDKNRLLSNYNVWLSYY